MKREEIQKIKIKSLQWVYVTKISKNILANLKKKFNLLDEDLREIPPPLQRQKVVIRPNYLFLILLFPIYDHLEKTMKISEADFFIGKNFIICFNQDARLASLRIFFNQCARNKKDAAYAAREGTSGILYEILKKMQEKCFPMLVHTSSNIDSIEAKLFREYEKKTIDEILRIKTSIADFRRTAWGDKEIIERLIKKGGQKYFSKKLIKKLKLLMEYAEEIWLLLETQTHSINTLHETNESLISLRTNSIMKTLTIFSVIVFPLTLLAAVFGMNTTMPLADSPYGFWKIVGLMAVGAGAMIGFFKWRRWI